MSIDTAEVRTTEEERRAERVARITGPKGVKQGPAAWEGQSAAIYCRISHANDEDQTGVDRQERICREIAERLRLQVASGAAFVDNNRSAWKRDRKRPGWDALLEAVRTGQVSHVIAYHPDRLMRQPADLEELLRTADEKRVTLHGQAGGRDLSDPDDRFILRIEVAHACRSSDDTSRRVRDKQVDRAREGKPHTGKRRFGYDKTGTKIIEEEAEIVRWVFSQYLDGKTPRSLAAKLTERGIRTPQGKVWTAGIVISLLDSRHVAGLRVFRGEEVGAGTWPGIIDVGTFREAQERREYRAAAVREGRSGRFYLLRSLVWCTRCGRRMTGAPSHGRPTYQCTAESKQDGKQCTRRISATVLDDFVSEAAKRLLEKLDITGREAAAVLTSAEADTIQADREKLAEAAQMWAAGEITKPEYLVMRKTIEERIKNAQRKTVVRPAAEVLRGMVGPNARESWTKLEEAGDYERLNALLRFLFAAVRIDASSTRGRAIDYGRIHIEPNPLD